MKVGKYIKPKVKEIVPKVFVVTYDNQYDLCMAFVRIQEFYESPKFKGKYFALEEFIEYWAKEHGHGSFDYTARWNGFNISGRVIKNWVKVFNEFETPEEMRDAECYLLDEIEKIKDVNGYEYEDIYVIGVHASQGKKMMDEAIEHELAHALYCLHPEYKKSCDALFKKLSKKRYGVISKTLIKMGYGKNVLEDEIQAYLSTGDDDIKQLKGDKRFAKNFKKFKGLV